MALALKSNRAVSALAGSFSIMLVLISSACFTAIDVTELPDGHYALKTLPGITSQTDDFTAMLGYGIFGLLLFLGVIPAVFVVLMQKAQANGTLWSPDCQAKVVSFTSCEHGPSLALFSAFRCASQL